MEGSSTTFAIRFQCQLLFQQSVGLPRNVLKRHQFGATLGGPIEIPHLVNGRDKAFFFVNYQGQRQTAAEANTDIGTFTPLELQGNFSQAVNGGPDPNLAAFLKANPYFQPNPSLAAQANYRPNINPAAQNIINLGIIPTSPSGIISTSRNATRQLQRSHGEDGLCAESQGHGFVHRRHSPGEDNRPVRQFQLLHPGLYRSVSNRCLFWQHRLRPHDFTNCAE